MKTLNWLVGGLLGLNLFGCSVEFSVGPSQPDLPEESATPIASVVPAPIPVRPSVAPVNFDKLSPCEQLDSVARSGKSVSQFLVAAHKVNDLAKYQSAIASVCPWNNEQLAVADRIIHPPVAIIQPQVQFTEAPVRVASAKTVSAPEPSYVEPKPSLLWVPKSQGFNNCNGVQEPGESYSRSCHQSQALMDAGVGDREDAIKTRNRHWDTPANGYNSK